MEALRAKGYDGALKEYLMLAGEGGERGGGKRFFGICIGMQVRGGFQYVLGGLVGELVGERSEPTTCLPTWLVGELVGELRSPIPPPRTSRPTLGWGGLAALVHPTPHTAHSHSLTHSLVPPPSPSSSPSSSSVGVV